MRLTRKLIYPSVVAALCFSSYQTSLAKDWDRTNNYSNSRYWDGYGNDPNQDSTFYNNEITYNAFPKGAKVVGSANYTIRSKYNDSLSEKLVNIGEKIQEKKNETVQRYDKKVSTIIDNEVEKTLNRIDGTIDTPSHAHVASPTLGYPHGVHNYGVVDTHHGVIATNVVPTHSSYGVYPKTIKRSAMYVGGSFNYGIFHGVDHVRNGIGTSAIIGMTSFDSNISAEFGLNYNRYNMGSYYGVPQNYISGYNSWNNINRFEEYSGSLNVRYQLTNHSALRPTLGLVAAYRYRTYTPNMYDHDYYTSVDAIDCGISAGVDFVINDKVSFGVDYKYMLNLHHAVDGFYQDNQWGNQYFGLGNTENLSYMLLNFTTRLYF